MQGDWDGGNTGDGRRRRFYAMGGCGLCQHHEINLI
jgi:hypothetical protein